MLGLRRQAAGSASLRARAYKSLINRIFTRAFLAQTAILTMSGSARRVCAAVAINLAILILSVIQAVAAPARRRWE
jgi:hypothetical protein